VALAAQLAVHVAAAAQQHAPKQQIQEQHNLWHFFCASVTSAALA
jgi:invasion protein IalB